MWNSSQEMKDGLKRPKDCEVSFDKTLFRFVNIVCKKNIQITLIMNIDQTAVDLVPGANDATYEIKRAKQVLIFGKDKKRPFTVILSGSCNSQV